MQGKFVRALTASLLLRLIRHDMGSDEELKALARSWLHRPVHPIVCRPDLTVADGNRRLMGLKLLGETEVNVFVTEEDLSDAELTEIGLLTAFHRKGLSGYEQWQAVEAISTAHPDWKQKDLAEHLHLDPGMVCKILSVSKCCRAVQEALKDQKIGITDAAALSRLGEEDQLVELTKLLNGGTRDRIAKPRRSKPDEPKEKAARIKIALAVHTDDADVNGTVTVASLPGEEIDLDSAEEMLTQALKALKDAKKRGLTVKTFARAMADMAAAGA